MSAEERMGRQGQSEGKLSTGGDLCTRTTAGMPAGRVIHKLIVNGSPPIRPPKLAAALMHVRAYLTLKFSGLLLQGYMCGLPFVIECMRTFNLSIQICLDASNPYIYPLYCTPPPFHWPFGKHKQHNSTIAQ